VPSDHFCASASGDTLQEHAGCVARVPIFNHLKPEEMREVSASIRPMKLKKGELLYRAGDISDSLFMVHRGKLHLYRLFENGKQQLVRVLCAGSFTGEFALFNRSVHDGYAEAVESSEICRIDRSDLQQLMLRYPDIPFKILQELSRRLEQAESRSARFTAEDAETRIAVYLSRLADEQSTLDIELPMPRRDLASLLGTTPETVSRKLASFEARGWIKQNGRRRIRILDPASLPPVPYSY